MLASTVMQSLPTLEAIQRRCSVRRFSQKDVSNELILELLESANRAPSGFNLQPWEFILVKDSGLKKLLCHVAMDQTQVLDAPATVVFLANTRAWKSSYKQVIAQALESGSIDQPRATKYLRAVRLLFQTSPFGLFGLAKRIAVPLKRLKTPVPNVITNGTETTHYVKSHTMLAAATFMIAAKGIGLDTCPMEGFDEQRLKKLLAIPKHISVPIIIPIGYALDNPEDIQTVRLPLREKTSLDRYGDSLIQQPN